MAPSRAVEGGAHGRVGVHILDEAADGRGRRVDGGPRAGDGEGALDGVAAAGDTGEAEADAGGNQFNGNRRQILSVNDGRVVEGGVGAEVSIGRTGNDNHPVGAEGEAARGAHSFVSIGRAVVAFLPKQRAVCRRILGRVAVVASAAVVGRPRHDHVAAAVHRQRMGGVVAVRWAVVAFLPE